MLETLTLMEDLLKQGELIAALKDNENIIAEFSGKLGKEKLLKGFWGLIVLSSP